MKTYTARFTGRKVSAIGITYYIVTQVDGENEENAALNLYDRYEHISGLRLEDHSNNMDLAK